MNVDLENVVKEVGNHMGSYSIIKKIEEFMRDCAMYNPKQLASLEKYMNYSINEIIELVRIERLFDLNLISLEEKKILYDEYNEYRKLRCEFGQLAYEKLFCKVDENKTLDKELYLRYEELKNKLESYGITADFDFKQVMVDGIDQKLNAKLAKKI